MSIQDVLDSEGLDIESINEDRVDIKSVAEDITRGTLPGPDNEPVMDGIGTAVGLVPRVVEDLNNWFNIVDVRIYDENHIGLPMRYRWSVIRWAHNDMDSWLRGQGWSQFGHLNADTRTRDEHEMEARYRKNYGDVTVDANFLVYFPDKVFSEMHETSRKDIVNAGKKKKERKATMDQVIEARRNGDV